MAFLILALPVGLYLVRQAQIFLPRAGGAAITVLPGECVTTKEGKQALLCGNVPLSLISPIGPPGATPSATPSITPTLSPSIPPTATPSATPNNSPTPPPGTGLIKGTVFKDFNGNGLIDGTDTHLSGSTVYLQDLTGTVTYAVFNSDQGGNYGFFNIGPGNYRVAHIPPEGYTPSSDESKTFTLGNGSVFIHNFGLKPNSTYLPGSLFSKLLGFVVAEVYAGDEPGAEPTHTPSGSASPSPQPGPFSISGTVFIDFNANGQVDSTDKRLPNEKVLLEIYEYDQGGRSTIGEMVTDAQGNYQFKNLVAIQRPTELSSGGYRVTHYVPAGYRKTTDDSHYPVRQDPNNPTADVVKLFGFTPNPQCSDKLDNDGDGLIDEADPVCHTDGNAGNKNSYNPDGPTEGEPPEDISYTICYRMAETQSDLGVSECVPYTNEPTLINYQLMNETPGQKQIWVRFEGVTNGVPKIQDEHITIELLEKDPVVSSVDCTLDLSSKNLKVTLKGERFGPEKGSVTANKTLLDILGWSPTEVSGILRNPNVPVEAGQKFTVILTRKDGKILPEQICRVDTGLISLGARVFCREAGKFDVENVKINLLGEDKSKAEETVTIDKDGTIGNLKTRLQAGKRYTLSIKAPYSLRRNATFTAATGTSVVAAPDGGPFILPVGDIAPQIKQDGKINSLDRALLSTQWRVLGTSKTAQTGDFNRDTKVNSVDWACMRYDFDASDDPIPDSVAPASTSTATPGGPLPSSTPSPSPVSSAQQASFNLTTASTSLLVNTEIQVKVNVRTDSDSANLFVAKITFPKDLVTVVKIDEAGSGASLVEKFFDNSTGQISIVGTTPNPGLKTNGSDSLFTTITFKGKAAGSAPLIFTDNSAIYRNSDNQNILGSKNGLTLTVN